MELLNKAELKTLLSNGRSPCISVYMPTHRNQEDPIRCKNLLTEAEERLHPHRGPGRRPDRPCAGAWGW